MVEFSGAASGRSEIPVVQNWFEELQARVPTGQSHKRLACPWGRQFVYHLPRERCALT